MPVGGSEGEGRGEGRGAGGDAGAGIRPQAMAEIEAVMGKLRPVATRASILYFVVADLANIDPMYQYSLEFFVLLFQGRLKDSQGDSPHEFDSQTLKVRGSNPRTNA